MAKALNILFVASEVYPFAKEGRLADFAFSLPLAMRELGNDVRVMMPKYGHISERKNKIHEINRLRDLPVKIGDVEELVTVKSSSIQNARNKVQAYIATNFTYFDSIKGIYADPVTGKDYPNNAERFIFFCQSVIETCIILEWYPDIIHCNDWQSALIPAYIKENHPDKFKKTKVILTVQDFKMQGEFPLKDFSKLGLPDTAKEHFKHKNKLNFLKGGVHYADFITTISREYEEAIIKDKSLSNGFNDVMKERQDKFKGIPIRTDPWVWNADEDNLIHTKYEYDFEEFKYNNKVPVINKYKFDFKPNFPLVSIISALTAEKGLNLFIEAADDILSEDVQIAILGRGEKEIEKKLKELSSKYPEKLRVIFENNDEFAHQVYAGSDMMLIPAIKEIAGLEYMHSALYGTIPIVSKAGALKDLIEEYDAGRDKGYAIVIKNSKKDELVSAFKKALTLFKDKEKWEEMAKRAMEEDFSWGKYTEQYVDIYRSV